MKRSKSTAIRAVHVKRKESTRARVVGAVRLLEREGRVITVSLVAEVAGVSRPTIYNHPELRSLVERKIMEQRDASRRLGSRMRAESREKARLQRENRSLRERVRRLESSTYGSGR